MAEVNFNRKLICKHCTEDIFARGSNVAIRCSVCPDQLDLCPDCFASRATLGDHEPHHPYQLIDNGGFPVLANGRTAREHIQLLDSVEQYGYGNWEDIARQITNENPPEMLPRTPEDTKEDFVSNFIEGTIGRYSWHEDQRGRARDHTQGNPLLPPSQPSEPPPNLTLPEAIILGYMAKRDDFEIEYDNDCERLVSQLQGSGCLLSGSGNGSGSGSGPSSSSSGGTTSTVDADDDEEVDLALKIAHVDMYKFKLRERERRRRVAREHQLISQYFKENPFTGNGERKSGGGGKAGGGGGKKGGKADLTERLKILAEFQGVQEHRAFVASVAKEKEIKDRIRNLSRFRKNGIRGVRDSAEYEQQRQRRIKRRIELKRRLEQQQQQQQQSVVGATLDLGGVTTGSPMSIKSEDMSNGGSPMPQLSPSKGMDDKLSVLSDLPGFDLLSANEKKLCLNLRLTPAHYISYKTCLLTNHLQKKKGQTPKPLNPSGMDKNNRKIIFQFLMRAGWITAY